MAKLKVIEGSTSGEAALQETYEQARVKAGDCNGCLILMQKKTGGIIWHAPDTMELRDLVFLVNGFAYQLSKMAAGDKP